MPIDPARRAHLEGVYRRLLEHPEYRGRVAVVRGGATIAVYSVGTTQTPSSDSPRALLTLDAALRTPGHLVIAATDHPVT